MRSVVFSLASLSLLPSLLAAPAPVSLPEATPAPQLEKAVTLEERQLLGGLLSKVPLVGGLLGNVESAIKAGNPTAIVQALVEVTPTARPTDILDASKRISVIYAPQGTQTGLLFNAVATQIANGLVLDGTLQAALGGSLTTGENSISNQNNANPSAPCFPKKDSKDAPYTLSEDALRKAIYIPKGFTYGTKPPMLLVPGTAAYGGTLYLNNIRKLFSAKSFADPVWLNIPGAMLADAQVNAEYIAYAMNYISAISKDSKISVLSLGHGGPATQWAFKYWLSTRQVVSDFFPIGGSFKGTIAADRLCLNLNNNFGANPFCPPSVLQMQVASGFTAALRSNGGDSAYVPTTAVYSGFFDEIVSPQQGNTASGAMSDVLKVGVTNVEVQTECSGYIGGTLYEHAGVLFHPLTYALIVDALTHEGPGDLSRIDLSSVCKSYTAPGIDLDDVVGTTAWFPIAAVLYLTYPQLRSTEPALQSYAST